MKNKELLEVNVSDTFPYESQYATYLMTKGKSLNTRYSYTRKLSYYAKFIQTYEEPPIRKVADKNIVNKFLTFLVIVKKVKASSLNCYKYALQSYFKFLDSLDIEKNMVWSTDILEPSKVHVEIPNVMGEADIRKFLNSINVVRDKALFLMLAKSGCRRFEVTDMKLEDLNMEDCNIVIKTKGGDKRVLMFDAETKRAIEAYLKVRGSAPCDWLFVGREYKGIRDRVDPNQVNRLFHRYLRKSSLKGFTVHSLRHAFAVRALLKGTNMEMLRRFMGHSNISTTQRYLRSIEDSTIREHYNKLYDTPPFIQGVEEVVNVE